MMNIIKHVTPAQRQLLPCAYLTQHLVDLAAGRPQSSDSDFTVGPVLLLNLASPLQHILSIQAFPLYIQCVYHFLATLVYISDIA